MDARIEPTREVLRRLWLGNGSISIRTDDVSHLVRAQALAVEGWLVRTGAYPCYGTTYTQYKASERLDCRALRDL